MSYNTWFAYRMCNGHKGNAGKWTVGYQRGPREEIHTAQRPSGGNVAFLDERDAHELAHRLNNVNAQPGSERT